MLSASLFLVFSNFRQDRESSENASEILSELKQQISEPSESTSQPAKYDDIFREYEKEYKIDEDEYLLFLIKLANLKKIEFTRNTYKDCYNINNYLVYLRKIVVLVQKYKKNLNKV